MSIITKHEQNNTNQVKKGINLLLSEQALVELGMCKDNSLNKTTMDSAVTQHQWVNT